MVLEDWSLKKSSFFLNLILPWKPNKILTDERHKLGRPSSNVITAKYGSHHFTGYEENAISPFSHYISLQWAFCCLGNQSESQITIILAILNCPYPKAVHLYKIRIILLDWFWKFLFFLNLILPWQPNKIAIGHKKYKLGKHSSSDHNCQTWFTSVHVFGENAINLTIFPI